jgi:hypothetical protein
MREFEQNVINLIAEIAPFQDSSQSNGSVTNKNARPCPPEPGLESVESKEQSESCFQLEAGFSGLLSAGRPAAWNRAVYPDIMQLISKW